MKYSMFKLSTLVAGALLISTPEIRAEAGHDHSKRKGHDHAPGKGHAAKATDGVIMSSHDGMTALYAHLQEISAALKAGKVEGVHDHAEAIGSSVKDLDKDTSLTEAKQKRVRGYVKNVLKLANKIHHAADEKKLAQAKKDFLKLEAQVDLLDKQFAHSHKPGVAAEPKAVGHHHPPQEK